jgi:hypothetical protein
VKYTASKQTRQLLVIQGYLWPTVMACTSMSVLMVIYLRNYSIVFIFNLLICLNHCSTITTLLLLIVFFPFFLYLMYKDNLYASICTKRCFEKYSFFKIYSSICVSCHHDIAEILKPFVMLSLMPNLRYTLIIICL